MSISSISVPYRAIFTVDEILQDKSATEIEEIPDMEECYQNYLNELNFELKTDITEDTDDKDDKEWIELHAGQCEKFGRAAKSILYRIVKSSVDNPKSSIAAANAITILNVMKVSFSYLDLQGVQIPDAHLSGAILDSADFSYANLEGVKLTKAYLNNTNMSKSNLKNVQFDVPDNYVYKILRPKFTEDVNKLVVARRDKHIVWNTEQHRLEKYVMQTKFVDISQDISLLIYYNWNSDTHSKAHQQLFLWRISLKKPLIVQKLSLAITKLQTSPDNRYIIGTVENGGIYVWKILENTFRLL